MPTYAPTLGGMLLNQAALNDSLDNAFFFQGSISCSAAAAANPVNALALSGGSAGSALSLASVDLAARLDGALTASMLLTASATSAVALRGNTFAALPSTPELGGMLLNQASVNDSLDATAGGIVCTANTSASLGFAHVLTGGISTSIAVQAAPTLLLALGGSLVITLLVSGSPSQLIALAGNPSLQLTAGAAAGKLSALTGQTAAALLTQALLAKVMNVGGQTDLSVAVGACVPSLLLALNSSVVVALSVADANALRETVAFTASAVEGTVLLIEFASLDMLATVSQDELFALAELVDPSGGLYAEAA